MASSAAPCNVGSSQSVPHACIPASVEALEAILDYYGFDYFFSCTLRMINLSSDEYADAVDAALDRYYNSEQLNAFSLRRAFRVIVADLMDDEEFSYEEALESLAEDDYVVPVDVAQTYSVDAGETDIECLSTLIRNRAKRLLNQSKRNSRP